MWMSELPQQLWTATSGRAHTLEMTITQTKTHSTQNKDGASIASSKTHNLDYDCHFVNVKQKTHLADMVNFKQVDFLSI